MSCWSVSPHRPQVLDQTICLQLSSSEKTESFLTRDEGEVSRTGDGEEGWRDVRRLDPIQGHLVQVGCVHLAVVVPSEAVEGDEQQLGAAGAQRRPKGGAAAGAQQ